MKQKKVVIVGDSAFAEIAFEYFEHDSEYSVAGFAVEEKYLKRNEQFALPVVPFEKITEVFSPAHHSVYVATVYTQLNRLRTRLMLAAKEQGYSLASYVSSKAFVWRNVKLGEHVFIFENNVVQPFVTIGDNAVLWSGNHIGHHSKLGNNLFISSHVVISGFCELKDNSFFGVNSTVANNVTVEEDCWIGPNVVIAKNTQPGQLYKPGTAEIAKVSAPQFCKVPATQ